jgi:hypothetical protein
MADSLTKVFNTPINFEFVEKNLDKIKAMAEGSEDAFLQLQEIATQDYIANLDLVEGNNGETIEEARQKLLDLTEEYGNITIDV